MGCALNSWVGLSWVGEAGLAGRGGRGKKRKEEGGKKLGRVGEPWSQT